MKPAPANDDGEPAAHTLDIVAELTGVSSQTILLYQEHGLIRPAAAADGFDDEAVHTLRRIEFLRTTSEANLSGIKLILDLMSEVERLQTALRARR